MVALAKTVNEAVAQILKRVGKESSEGWKVITLEHLNDALEYIGGEHDWKYLVKNSTVTTSDATGVVSLPSDCDRILALYQSGSKRFLQTVDALTLAMEKEAAAVTWSQFWAVYGYEQDTDTEPPVEQIEIYTAPASGTEFQIIYIKRLDELAATATVPNIPPRIWNVVQAKALLETLINQEQPAKTITVAQQHFALSLQQAKRAEKYGGVKYDTIRLEPALSRHLRTRFT